MGILEITQTAGFFPAMYLARRHVPDVPGGTGATRCVAASPSYADFPRRLLLSGPSSPFHYGRLAGAPVTLQDRAEYPTRNVG